MNLKLCPTRIRDGIMKRLGKCSLIVLLFSVTIFFSCSSDNVKSPQYHSEISLDDNLNVVDMGRAGQSTDDGNYHYYGSVTLYDEDGGSRNFRCYTGKYGSDAGCRGVVYAGDFYNLDRNGWVTIGGVKYKASNLVD